MLASLSRPSALLLARRSAASARFASTYKSIGSDAEFKTFMDAHKAQNKLVVVDWFATWCAPRCSHDWSAHKILGFIHPSEGSSL